MEHLLVIDISIIKYRIYANCLGIEILLHYVLYNFSFQINHFTYSFKCVLNIKNKSIL